MIYIYIAGKVKKRCFIEYENIVYLEPFNYANGLNIFDSNIYVPSDCMY